MLLIDYSNFCYRAVFSQPREFSKDNFSFFRHIFYQSLFSMINKFTDSKVIIAVDNKSWRKIKYPEYKAHRKDNVDKLPFKIEDLYEFQNKLLEEIQQVFPIGVIKIPYTEADDIIGAVAQKFKIPPNEELIIVSADKDMIQTKLYQDCIIYDPIKRTQLFEDATKQTVEFYHKTKILIGDKGDNIPNVQYGIGEKKAAKIIMLPEEELNAWLDEGDRRANYERNYELISFDKTPEVIQEKVMEKLSESFQKIREKMADDSLFHGIIRYYKEHELNKLKSEAEEQVDLFLRYCRW